MQRLKQYSKVSTSLACLSNEKLKQILADSKPMHEGIGGKSALISIVGVTSKDTASTGKIPTSFVSALKISIMDQRILLYFLNMSHRICMTG